MQGAFLGLDALHDCFLPPTHLIAKYTFFNAQRRERNWTGERKWAGGVSYTVETQCGKNGSKAANGAQQHFPARWSPVRFVDAKHGTPSDGPNHARLSAPSLFGLSLRLCADIFGIAKITTK